MARSVELALCMLALLPLRVFLAFARFFFFFSFLHLLLPLTYELRWPSWHLPIPALGGVTCLYLSSVRPEARFRDPKLTPH